MADTTLNVVTLEGVKLNLSSGDTLVIMYPRILSTEQRFQIKAAAETALPDGAKVLVLDGGMTIAAISANA